MTQQRLAILGATGSIGTSTLDVVSRHPDRFKVVVLTGHRRLDVLAGQCRLFKPRYAVVGNPDDARNLAAMLSGNGTEVLAGPEALVSVATLEEVDTVMAAIVGAAGLPSTLAAAKAGKKILLANKEVLVMAGGIFMREAIRGGALILPIDSEHNAVFQSLPSNFDDCLNSVGVSKILLTASGGPFRTASLESLRGVTPEQACAHPNWSMGRKISVDSATMMNKGLEVIEARWLFNAHPDQIDVVIHPQSIIHSLVQYLDGSVIAELGNPDMRTPIAHALAYPERIDSGVKELNLFEIARLDFEKPDLAKFPCLDLAYQALRCGGLAPAVLNAANEVAVDAFLQGSLPFLSIADTINTVMDQVEHADVDHIDGILETDRHAREVTRSIIARLH